MITVDVKFNKALQGQIKSWQQQVAALPAQSLVKFRSLTPYRTGNARRRTTLRGRDTIEANYPYAKRLDEGWSSQAKQGMTKPFDKWLKDRLTMIFGR